MADVLPAQYPQNIRRGFKWTAIPNPIQLFQAGTDDPMPLTGWTLTGGLRLGPAKDAVTAGVTVTVTQLDSPNGIFTVSVSAADTAQLSAGRQYHWYVYGNHATHTGGVDQLLYHGPVQVVA